MTYQELKEQLERMTELMSTYNAIASCGVPQKSVHHWVAPKIMSGYTMGEEVRIRCGATTIQDIDQRKYYAKSCKWHEKHGYVLIDLSKANVKRYLSLLTQLEYTDLTMAERDELRNQAKDILCKSINKEHSQIKSLTIWV